ncbi:MAG: hypothetical protein NC930_04050 [Candidatus Omnitrophica bacterium]|nr:hypothetical protein [Candidatus Omnitrophota bacterium]
MLNKKKIIFQLSCLTGYRIPLSAVHGMDIEPVAACNLNCEFCVVSGWDRARKTPPMSLKLLR